jgi:hypothetical protein
VALFMPFIVRPDFSLEITHREVESLGHGVKKRKWFFGFFSVRGVSVVKKQQGSDAGQSHDCRHFGAQAVVVASLP